MGTVFEILWFVFPVMLAGGMVLFVIKRLEKKHKKGAFETNKKRRDSNILDYAIPMGLMFGCVLGVIIGLFSPISTLLTVSLGTTLGYGCGLCMWLFN